MLGFFCFPWSYQTNSLIFMLLFSGLLHNDSFLLLLLLQTYVICHWNSGQKLSIQNFHLMKSFFSVECLQLYLPSCTKRWVLSERHFPLISEVKNKWKTRRIWFPTNSIWLLHICSSHWILKIGNWNIFTDFWHILFIRPTFMAFYFYIFNSDF